MDYEEKAIQFAEKYGIIDYSVTGNVMTYTESFLLEAKTYEARVDLDTMKETRTAKEKSLC